MNDYTEFEIEVMKLWREIYTTAVKGKNFGKSKSTSPTQQADSAVDLFKKRFDKSGNVRRCGK
jgi:hypothetical protein